MDEYIKWGSDYEHRVIYRIHYGGIPEGWHVHHVDFNKTNNNPENLLAVPAEIHTKLHTIMRICGFKYDRKTLVAKLKTAKKMRKESPNCVHCKKKKRNCKCKVFEAAWRLSWPKTAVERFENKKKGL